jgi:hypothetical protein
MAGEGGDDICHLIPDLCPLLRRVSSCENALLYAGAIEGMGLRSIVRALPDSRLLIPDPWFCPCERRVLAIKR